jgi:hypothetical protein
VLIRYTNELGSHLRIFYNMPKLFLKICSAKLGPRKLPEFFEAEKPEKLFVNFWLIFMGILYSITINSRVSALQPRLNYIRINGANIWCISSTYVLLSQANRLERDGNFYLPQQ